MIPNWKACTPSWNKFQCFRKHKKLYHNVINCDNFFEIFVGRLPLPILAAIVAIKPLHGIIGIVTMEMIVMIYNTVELELAKPSNIE